MLLAACLKLVDRRPEVDPLSGAVHADPRAAGASDADQAALEWALRAAETWGGSVLAVTAGPPEADAVLRDALAVGAARAVRVDVAPGASSAAVATGLAAVAGECALVWCGDHSLDRGSGSVPAFLAAHLGAAQALGLVEVAPSATPGDAAATRRLDRGRRERLRVRPQAVLSLEGATARLRRATVAGELAARHAPIEVVPGPATDTQLPRTTRPFRPRARVLAAPAGDSALQRVLSLTDAASGPPAAPALRLEPAEAAERILATLAAWGYLEPRAGG